VGHPHTGLLPGTYHLLPAAFLGNIAASCPLLNSLPSVNPSLSVSLAPSSVPPLAPTNAHYIAASATRCSVLLACLPPAARSSTWRRSRLVPPTQHPASCHPPLTPPGPTSVPPLSPTNAHYSAASATRCSVLLGCLPPAARSSTWRRSRLVPPTHHSARCHPPLTPPSPSFGPASVAHYVR
jgi:hypothetical protein